MGGAVIASLVSHAAVLLFAVLAIRYVPAAAATSATLPFQANRDIIWLSQPGPGGGGGGGGNRMEAPPRPAEEPGKDKITVPVAKPPKLEPPKLAKNEPDPIAAAEHPGEEIWPPRRSRCLARSRRLPPLRRCHKDPAAGGGAGTGAGSGIGPGTGSGLGPGSGGGTGGGVYQPGNGVTMPRLIREVKPNYTSDAMRAKVSGTVLLECVVNPNGEVTEVRILRSLDPMFGLDQEAIKAAKQWRFSPGMRLGAPVSVLISIELSFTLR